MNVSELFILYWTLCAQGASEEEKKVVVARLIEEAKAQSEKEQ